MTAGEHCSEAQCTDIWWVFL